MFVTVNWIFRYTLIPVAYSFPASHVIDSRQAAKRQLKEFAGTATKSFLAFLGVSQKEGPFHTHQKQ